MQYTSRAAQLYKQQLEKDVAKFDSAAYLSSLKGKPTEAQSVTAVTATDKELVAANGSSRSRPSSQNGSSSNLAALDDSSVEGAPASSTASVASAQGDQLAQAICTLFTVRTCAFLQVKIVFCTCVQPAMLYSRGELAAPLAQLTKGPGQPPQCICTKRNTLVCVQHQVP